MCRDAVGRSDVRSGALSLAVERDHAVLRLTARGELDLATAPELEEQLRGAQDADAKSVVVDLAGVPFMDCSGLRVLLAAREQLGRRGGTVALGGRSPQVRRLMKLTGTLGAFSIARENGAFAAPRGQAHAA